ncbi:hypothetical protein Nizo2264_1549 [Lactiplantibacillus plantarum]|nr:hypothetical protein Nizo2264_1549 [Lactiplantibacillus plantarum]
MRSKLPLIMPAISTVNPQLEPPEQIGATKKWPSPHPSVP